MMYFRCSQVLMIALLATAFVPASLCKGGLIIGVDNRFPAPDSSFASSSSFDEFRAELSSGGNTIVPLSSFLAADLAALDFLVINQPYRGFGAVTLSVQEIADIHDFVSGNFVAFGDASMFSDTGAGSDRDISFGDNRQLLTNAVDFVGQRAGSAMFFGDGATGANHDDLSALVAPYGLTYSTSLHNGNGITLTPDFVPHPVTQGVTTIGMDLRRLLTTQAPAVDLTVGSGTFDFVAAGTVAVPEPSSAGLGLLAWGAVALGRRRR